MNYCSISCSKKGKIPPNILIAQKASPINKPGNPSHLKGKKREFTDKWLENLKVANIENAKLKRGANHWNWKGGITDHNHAIRTSAEYKEWRLSVLKRDRFSCVECGYRSVKPKDIVVDHIKPFYLYPELRLTINNGRTLCIECDKRISFNYSRHKSQTLTVA